MYRSTKDQAARIGLILWLVTAAFGLAFAPPPPPPPPLTPAAAALQRQHRAQALAIAERWQATRGDRVLPWEEASGHLAIIIDDVGRELHLFEQLHGLRDRLTFAVLPHSIYAAGIQLRLRDDRRRPRELLLHLPMEPRDRAVMDREAASGELFLELGDPPEVLQSKLDDALARVPAAIGVNNHMGSALTADRAAMEVIAAALSERGLFAVDSLTTPDSTFAAAAVAAGVPTLRRAVFLDHDPRPEAIERALREAAEASRARPVVVIAHPSAAVVDTLRRELPRLFAAGIAVYPLRELLARGSGEAAAEPRG